MTTPTPELVALLELSERATPGEWEVVNGSDVFTELGGARLDGLTADANDGWHIADFSVGLMACEQIANAAFVTTLVNWFRETHKEKKG